MTVANTNALSADGILYFIDKSLPTSIEQQMPLLKDPYAAIALFSHACMLAVGFRLIGLGEDHKIEAQSNPENTQPLPSEWNASSAYAFRYAHSQSSLEYLIKVTRLGGKAIIFGVGLGDDKTASFEIKAQDYTSEGSLKEATGAASDRKAALKNAFISSGRMEDLASLYKLNILQKLAPGIQKAGYEENSAANAQHRQPEAPRQDPRHDPLRDDQPAPARPQGFDDPLAAAPRRSGPIPDFAPPGFEDEHEINRPPPLGIPLRGRPYFGGVGQRDLYPPGLGPHDPLRIGPGGLHGGGGMHPTFDDPLFGGQGGQQPFNPRAPPGARYDPVGPGDGPPNLRGGPRFPGGPPGGGGNPFGGFGGGDFI